MTYYYPRPDVEYKRYAARTLALVHEGLSWTHPDVFPLMLCQTLLGTVDKKNASGKFTASPLAKYLARDGLVESMRPFCAPRLPVRACTWSGWPGHNWCSTMHPGAI